MQRSKSRCLLGAGILTVGALMLTGCGGSNFDDPKGAGSDSQKITVMIGSSGDAETQAVTAAVAGWAADTGVSCHPRPTAART